jgi:hypothetical protein
MAWGGRDKPGRAVGARFSAAPPWRPVGGQRYSCGSAEWASGRAWAGSRRLGWLGGGLCPCTVCPNGRARDAEHDDQLEGRCGGSGWHRQQDDTAVA